MPRIALPQQARDEVVRLTRLGLIPEEKKLEDRRVVMFPLQRPVLRPVVLRPANESRRGASEVHGQLVYNRSGVAIGFQDRAGTLIGANDPRLSPVVAEILEAEQRKQPTNGFELWKQQNPKESAERYLELMAEGRIKPLEQQLLDAKLEDDFTMADAILCVMQRGQAKVPGQASSQASPIAGVAREESGRALNIGTRSMELVTGL